MLKKIALIALVWCIPATVHAGLGVQAGIGLNQLTAPTGITPGDFPGLAAGLVFETPVGPFVSLQAETIFVMRGSDIVSASSALATARYNTIGIPVFVVANLGMLRLFAGPNFDINFGHRLTSGGGVTFVPKTLDLGLAAGVGLEFGPVFINARILRGLGELDATQAGWKSGGFLFLAGAKI